ncbi:MAG TPA: EthD family reductase [Acidimicrobiales bacterium]|nr:EthD family reductase [Acidimicrobiales bacterium]
MIKLIVLYGTPTDPAAFDEYYKSTHIPLAEKIPGVRRIEVAKMASLDGSTPQFHLQAELYFDDQAALMSALGTPEGAAAGADVANFATGGATMLVGDVMEEAGL